MKYYHFDRRGGIKTLFDGENPTHFYMFIGKGRPNGYCIGLLDSGNKSNMMQDFSIDENEYETIMKDLDDDSYHLPNFDVCKLIEKLKNNASSELKKFIVEVILEIVRVESFPDNPSRFESLFAVENLEDLNNWKGQLNITDEKIYTFQARDDERVPSKLFLADANLLEEMDFNDIKKCKLLANSYWKGDKSRLPKTEVILQGLILLDKKTI